MRIHVTGNAGAGKTTLARKLGEELGLPVLHMDQVVWRSGWKEVPTDERMEQLRLAVRPKEWVIEGVSSYVREQADLVVFLDIPRHVCVWRCAKRNWRYLFRSRPELPANCAEWRIIPKLIGIIWRFPSLVGDPIMSESQSSSKYRVFKSSSESDGWFEKFVSVRAA